MWYRGVAVIRIKKQIFRDSFTSVWILFSWPLWKFIKISKYEKFVVCKFEYNKLKVSSSLLKIWSLYWNFDHVQRDL